MSVEYLENSDTSIPFSTTLANIWPEMSANLRAGTEQTTKWFSDYVQEHPSTSRLFPDPASEISHCLATTESYIGLRDWRRTIRIDQIPDQLSNDFFETVASENVRHGLHFPAKVDFRGVMKPAIVCSHHAAHASSAFYLSDYETSAVLTVDGSTPADPGSYKGGMFYVGRGTDIIPVWPHGLGLGNLYSLGAAQLGFGSIGEGKFMGLTPYGRPAFMDHRFVGCIKTGLENLGVTDDYFTSKHVPPIRWVEMCRARAEAAGYDMSGFGDTTRITEPANADFAASTQKLFEETLLHSVRQLADSCDRLGVVTNNLCLAGGTMLNCPANSRIANESAFENLYIVPGCDDSGLAIGAALFLSHNILSMPRVGQNPNSTTPAYLGREVAAEEIRAAIARAGNKFTVTEVGDVAEEAGRALANNKVVAWFEGRSEFGPRALGHRSLLADPRDAENWARVNRIKGRESWRPFAPAVLEEKQVEWFTRCPSPSPLMLFTGQARRPDLPAITHLDGSSRIQSVARDCGGYRRLIEVFDAETNCPVVLNTSLNGPAEPIVERPEEALRFLENSGADMLFMEGFRVTLSDGVRGQDTPINEAAVE